MENCPWFSGGRGVWISPFNLKEFILVGVSIFLKSFNNFGEGFSIDLFKKKNINLELACTALLTLVQIEDPTGKIDSHRIYHIPKIIKALQENAATDQDKLSQIEWAYLPLLDWHSDGDGSPVTLENRLASDPDFFCELIQLIYRAKGEESKENPSPKQRNIATNAYRLLSIWKIVPGSQAGGELTF
jgi:hypothetical protein